MFNLLHSVNIFVNSGSHQTWQGPTFSASFTGNEACWKWKQWPSCLACHCFFRCIAVLASSISLTITDWLYDLEILAPYGPHNPTQCSLFFWLKTATITSALNLKIYVKNLRVLKILKWHIQVKATNKAIYKKNKFWIFMKQ